MKTIIQKPILHINSEELPHMIRFDILGKDYDDTEFNEIYEGITRQINDPIKIDDLLSILNTLKGKGANYVAIRFHTDHQEYEFDGVHIGLATQEEIDDYNQRDKEFQIKTLNERIKVLSTELGRFQNQLKKISGE